MLRSNTLPYATLLATLLTAATLPAQPRRGGGDEDIWKTLATRYDRNKDGRIEAAEYPRGEEKFRRLDSNRDGTLTAADFEGAGRRSRGRSRRGGRDGRGRDDFRRRLGGRLLRSADADGNDEVSSAEWKALLDTLGADDEGVVDTRKLGDLLPGRRPGGGGGRGDFGERMLGMLDRDGDERVELADLEPLFAEADRDESGTLEVGELQDLGRGGGERGRGGRGERGRGERGGGAAPQVGDPAPDFELPFAKNEDKSARLSSFAGKRPVALVFGSYT